MTNKLILLIPTTLILFSFSHCSIKKPNGGGSYGGSIPSYSELTDDLNDILKGPVKDAKCLDLKNTIPSETTNELYPFGNPLNGALTIHATKYQSCMILNNIKGSVGFDGKQPDVLNKWRSTNPKLYPSDVRGCLDLNDIPKFKGKITLDYPIKTNCSVVSYCQDPRSPNITNNILDPLKSSTDCSSFVGSSFRAVGLKMTKDQVDKNWWPPNTNKIGEGISNGNSCFEKPVGNIDDLIRSGDILNSLGEHVVMIDKVGKDPFRIEEILDRVKSLEITKEKGIDACGRLNISRFNLMIIHSTRNSTGSGIVREQSRSIGSETAREILEEYARNACIHFISQYPEANNPFDSSSIISKARGGRGSLQRHKGNKDRECVFPTKPEIKGAECVKECINNYTI